MGPFVSYILQSSFVMTMLYLVYKWLMAPTTFHAFNRAVLLGIYLVSWTLPFFLSVLTYSPVYVQSSPVDIMEVPVLEAVPMEESSGIDWWRLLLRVYSAGLICTAGVSLAGIWRMVRIIRSGVRCDEGRFVKIVTQKAPGPFSWGKYIVLRPEDCDSEMWMVVEHEKVHLRCFHWVDLIIAQATAVIQWFSPAAWLMMNELKTVHEFQVDRVVGNGNPVAYQMMLLKKTVGSSFPTFADSLNHSQIKIRITMMMTKRTRPSRKVAALALPAMGALAAITLSFPTVADVVRCIGNATMVDVAEPRLKITKTSPSVQILPSAIAEESAIENGADGSLLSSEEMTEPREASGEQDEKETVGADRKSPAIFVDGKEFKGNINEVNVNDIVAMDVVKNDPAYPQGKIMITTVNAADGEERPALSAEKCAEFKGGQGELMQFLAANVRYPAEAQEAKASGRVVVSFTIGKDGSVKDPKVMKGIHPSLDAEAVRVVMLSSGKWEPAANGGVPVASRFTLPVTFKLQ